ncbi:glycosyltransferase [Lunatimonas salinarum]|uniref:glycosyltransferase n=1 Tax=Lunatimonas salinarum TaxID=1774590 RepID=UPI001AE0DFC7|nr:hypothetical protein [Lunatimonas salinarum]
MNAEKSASSVVLMDPFPAMGHVQAFLNLADWMKEQGFEIVFLTNPDFSSVVTSRGYRVILVNPFLLAPEKSEIQQAGWVSVLVERISGKRKPRLIEEMKARRLEYAVALRSVSPSLVFLDDHFALKAFLYERISLPTLLVSTMTLPHRVSGTPPFQSVQMPATSAFSALRIRISWNRVLFSRWCSRFWKELLLGETNHVNVIRSKYRLSKLTLDTDRCFGIGVKELPIIAAYPKSFDFAAASHKENKYYFGRLPDIPSEQSIQDQRLIKVIDLVKSSGKRLVFCSLGTVTINDLGICERFFNNVISLAGRIAHAFFVLSIGGFLDIHRLGKTPANVSVFSSVPQRILLSHVDLMIHHGGINSIKECIAAEVPMLAFPLSLKWDQPGCAARLVYLGLGQMGNIRKDSLGLMEQKIRYMLDHAVRYQAAIRSFKAGMTPVNEQEHQRLRILLEEMKLIYPNYTKRDFYEVV